jgi:hypothetical protein
LTTTIRSSVGISCCTSEDMCQKICAPSPNASCPGRCLTVVATSSWSAAPCGPLSAGERAGWDRRSRTLDLRRRAVIESVKKTDARWSCEAVELAALAAGSSPICLGRAFDSEAPAAAWRLDIRFPDRLEYTVPQESRASSAKRVS